MIFLLLKKYFFAYNLVKVWPKWNNQLVYIYGPEKCGKTLISNIWIERSKAKYLSYKTFNKIIKDDLDIELIKRFNWVLDDVDKLIEETTDFKKLLNFINVLKTNKDSYLLMTGQKPPKHIECDLDDLTSRLLTSIVVEVKDPDKELLSKIIKKYLNDRNITLSISTYLSFLIEWRDHMNLH